MTEHTNCWCAPNVFRCSLPDCPRWQREARQRADREKLHKPVVGEKNDDWGRMELHNGRGVWVPERLTAAEIAKAAEAVEDRFAIDKHTARSIAITVLQAARDPRRLP